MSSAPPPTYNFSNINFNSSFYTTTSTTGFSLASAKKIFLSKTSSDTAIGPISFTSPTSISQALNLSNSSTNFGTINFNNIAGNVLATLYSDSSGLNIDFKDLTEGFNVVANSLNVLKVLASGISLSSPYSLSYSTPPTLSNNQVGFSYNSSTVVSHTFSALGSITLYNSTNQVPLPVGIYYFSGGYTTSPSGFSGTVQTGTGFQIGYALGTSSTPASNARTSLYNGISNIITSNVTNTNVYSVGAVVNINTANSYLTSFYNVNISAYTSGSLLVTIPYYTVVRIA